MYVTTRCKFRSFLLVAYLASFVTRRSLWVAALVIGQLANEGLNVVLKHIIKQPRPVSTASSYVKSYGMPSDHAQFMAFAAVFVGLFFIRRLRLPEALGDKKSDDSSNKEGAWVSPNKGAYPRFVSLLIRWGAAALGVSGAAAVAWSRVYLGYHTTEQIAAGFALGAVVGIAYYLSVERSCCPQDTSRTPFSLEAARGEAKRSLFALLASSWAGRVLGLEY